MSFTPSPAFFTPIFTWLMIAFDDTPQRTLPRRYAAGFIYYFFSLFTL